MSSTISVESIRPIDRSDAMEVAKAEYERFEELLASLGDDEWALETPDCPTWTVKGVVSHVIGGCGICISMRGTLRLARAAEKLLKDPTWNDPAKPANKMVARNNAMNEVQIRERAGRSPAQLVQEYRETWPRALAARGRKPRILDAVKVQFGEGKLSPGFLFRVVYTRDTWMHRADIARATRREMRLDAAHDGRIVADAVADWARTHGQPFRLVLTGSAGGTFVQGDGGPSYELDAVDFCRLLSGRGTGEGLLARTIIF